jgi:hypothetical protein
VEVAYANDANELSITVDVIYTWEVVNNGRTVTDAGLFTAGNKAGTYTDTVKVTAVYGEVIKSALATVIVNAEPKKDKTVFTPFGWLQGLKKGCHGLPFPPGWYKNGKATQSGDEVTTTAPQCKRLQNKNIGNKNK